MEQGLSVCHVVNAVDETSLEADLAAEQARFDEVDEVGMVAWFHADPFYGDDRVTVSELGVPGGSLLLTPGRYATLRDTLAEYDVIHTHHNHSGFYAKLIARRLGKPSISTEHNNHVGFSRKGRIANGLTNLLADEVICVSDSVRDSFPRWESHLVDRGDRVGVITNGAHLERIDAARDLEWSIDDAASIDPAALVVGSAGMLTEQKAQEVLIQAVDEANQRSDRPIELVISGDGDRRAQLEAQIANAEFSDRLHLLGFLEKRDQVYKMLHEIDIYAMPSRWEGLCVAALEAMAAENPCVFSAIPEFTRPFDGYARFHEVDDSTGLADELLALSNASDERTELGERGRDLVAERYSLRRVAADYLERYEAVRSA